MIIRKHMNRLLTIILIIILITTHRNHQSRSNSLPRSNAPRRRTIVSTTVTNQLDKQQCEHDSEANEIILQQPPWNPSPNIDTLGYLTGYYHRLPGEWEKDFYTGREDCHDLNSDVPSKPLRTHPCYQNTNNDLHLPCRIRQVPGDGNCLFHSISLSLYYAVNGTQWDITDSNIDHDSSDNYRKNRSYEDLYYHSKQLRKAAVECLSSSLVNRNNQQRKSQASLPNCYHRRKYLYLQGREYLSTSELLNAAASQYYITPEEYCNSMEQDCVWGGGPEIVALCNILKRPIHVYELATMPETSSSTREDTAASSSHIVTKLVPGYKYQSNSGFVLRRMACFGSPKFDKNRALHILSADSRFPDIQPGKQLPAGNHFLAVFPLENEYELSKKNQYHKNIYNTDGLELPQKRTKLLVEKRKNKKQRVRGGFFISKDRPGEDSDVDTDSLTLRRYEDPDLSPKGRTITEELQYQHSTYNSILWMSIQWWKDVIHWFVLGR